MRIWQYVCCGMQDVNTGDRAIGVLCGAAFVAMMQTADFGEGDYLSGALRLNGRGSGVSFSKLKCVRLR